MFAVKILSETWKLILERDVIPPTELESVKRYYLDQEYVLITGATDQRGRVEEFTILPIYVFAKHYEYDPVAIQHDWDIVVKPFPDDEQVRLPYKD